MFENLISFSEMGNVVYDSFIVKALMIVHIVTFFMQQFIHYGYCHRACIIFLDFLWR